MDGNRRDARRALPKPVPLLVPRPSPEDLPTRRLFQKLQPPQRDVLAAVGDVFQRRSKNRFARGFVGVVAGQAVHAVGEGGAPLTRVPIDGLAPARLVLGVEPGRVARDVPGDLALLLGAGVDEMRSCCC